MATVFHSYSYDIEKIDNQEIVWFFSRKLYYVNQIYTQSNGGKIQKPKRRLWPTWTFD